MVTIKRVSTKEEISGIKTLQNSNLRSSLTEAEIQREGFVTAQYTLEFLELMNQQESSVIAKDGDQVVGYALVATRQILGKHALLDDLFAQIDKYQFHGEELGKVNYVVVGQLCVAKSHRGQGLVQQMYDFYRKELSATYPYCLTDVDERNPRSIKAHLKSGFEILGTLTFEGNLWHIVIWDWNRQR